MRVIRLPALVLLAACATGPRPVPGEAAPTPAPGAEAAARPPAPPPPPPAAPKSSPYYRDDVSDLREEAHEVLQQQSELAWKSWALGEQVNLAQVYTGHAGLFTPASLRTVRSARTEASGDAQRALRNLELYLVGELIAQETAKLTDEIANMESSESVLVDGVRIPYRDVDRTLANEASAAKRAKLYAAETQVLARLNPLLQRKQEQLATAAKALGYKSYAELGAQLRDVQLDTIAQLAEKTLSETEPLYVAVMEQLAHDELALPLAKVKRSDVPRLFRGTTNEAAFPASRLVPTAQSIFSGLGIDLLTQKGLKLDTSPLSRKNPRAVCIAGEVPTDVRVSVKPKGGAEDYRALMHELGHAEQYLNTLRTEWEFQQLGNSTVAESYAFLLEGIIDNPQWLTSTAKLDDESLKRAIRLGVAERLYLLRRYAAKLLFEIEWHSGELKGPPSEAYRRLLSRAYGFELTPEDGQRYLVDHDDFFYSADYFRAWFLAAQLEQYLTTYYGPRWWESKEAGRYLKALWAYGTQPSADEIAQRLGQRGVDPSALVKLLSDRLNR
jgi:hypothetical protein